MTRPVYEPSLTRTDATLGFGNDQLFRRPAPTAGCPCEYEWAVVAGTTTVTVNNNTLTTIEWSDYAIAPGATAFSINTATQPFKILLDGWYLFLLDVEWTGAGFTDVRLHQIDASLGIDNHSYGTYGPRIETSSPFTSGATLSPSPLHLRSFSSTNKMKALLYQSSGSGKDLASGYFTIVYLGPGLGIDDGVTTINDLYVSF